MVFFTFLGERFTDFCRFMSTVETFHERYHLQPLIDTLNPLVTLMKTEFISLQSSFLDGYLAPIPSREGFPFTSESTKRDVAAAARRWALGVQSRGVHVSLREAATKDEHVAMALEARHPHTLLHDVLEIPWRFVFAQFEASLAIRSLDETCIHILAHRMRMIEWVRQSAAILKPIQDSFLSAMPPVARRISGHVNIALFYGLLVCVGYPHPEVAFRLFLGAPLVGHFYSPALPTARRQPTNRMSLSDINIREVARKSYLACIRILPTLVGEAAAECMRKMKKEFAKESLVGPFPSFWAMCTAMQQDIREVDGCEEFEIDPSLVIACPQFTVEESHSYDEEKVLLDDWTHPLPGVPELPLTAAKIRNIWNGKPPNKITSMESTYIPNNHADISVLMLMWIAILSRLAIDFEFLAWPSDFTSAYRQCPLLVLHIMFAGTCYYDYDDKCLKWGYYRSLPFGSSLAPAGWSEIVHALCFLMAFAFLAILTHCVDDVCCIELAILADSSRDIFVELCELIGLKLDMEKTLKPCSELIYLGLKMVLPCRLLGNHREFSLSIPEQRRRRLIRHLEGILQAGELSSGDSASHRGRLFFYAYWEQEARSYLSEFAARQYNADGPTDLTEELVAAIRYFLELLRNPRFLAGIKPETIMNRETCVMYTDGSLEGDGATKGIGGVLFSSKHDTPLAFGEYGTDRPGAAISPEEGGTAGVPPDLRPFDKIAPIEMHAIYRAIQIFGPRMYGKAVLFFVDNTHAIGCLLKRSTSIRERQFSPQSHTGNYIRDKFFPCEYSHYNEFMKLSDDLRRIMNAQARAIWKLITEFNLLVWFEYVHTDCNIADPPSRGEPLPNKSCSIRAIDVFTGQPLDSAIQ